MHQRLTDYATEKGIQRAVVKESALSMGGMTKSHLLPRSFAVWLWVLSHPFAPRRQSRKRMSVELLEIGKRMSTFKTTSFGRIP